MNIYGPIRPIEPAGATAPVRPLQSAGKPVEGDFQSLLTDFVRQVDGAQKGAETSLADLATGKIDNIHDVMIAMGKAEVSFKFMMEVRDRLLDAYQQIMRMPV